MDLAQLFNLHAQDVRRFLTSRVACDATVADLTQEAFLRLARMPDLGAVENFRTYLFRIATNLATDHLRARTRRPLSSSSEPGADLLALPGSAATPESVLLAKQELAAAALRAFGELSPPCRQIFALNRFELKRKAHIRRKTSVDSSPASADIPIGYDLLRTHSV